MTLDPDTALVIFFGSMAFVGAIVVAIDWIGQRQQRRTGRQQK